MLTTPFAPSAVARADQYVQQQGQTLLVEPRLIDLLGDLPTRVHRPRLPGDGTFEIDQVLDSLLMPQDGMVYPNAGLLPVLAQLARNRHLTWDAAAFDRRLAHLTVEHPELLPPGLAGWLSNEPRGRIQLGNGVNAALLIARISQAFPKAKIIVLATREDQLKSLAEDWVRLAQQRRLSLTEIGKPNGGIRIATFLNGDDRESDVLFHEFDLVIVLRAPDICHVVAQRALSEQGARFRLIGIDQAGSETSLREADLMLAAYGPAVFKIPAEGMGTANVQTVFAVSHPRPLDPQVQHRDLQTQGYWLNHVRNRRIARLANGLARSDKQIINDRYPEIAPWWQEGDRKPLRTVLIAANLQHAAELLGHLPQTASLATSATDTELRRLSQTQQKLVETRKTHQLGNPLVTDRSTTWSALHTDCVVNAAGGPGIPQGPVFLADREPRRRVLVVDFHDRHHHQLRQLSHDRRRAYEQRGWYAWGMTEREGRIQAFLNSRRDLMTRNTRKPR